MMIKSERRGARYSTYKYVQVQTQFPTAHSRRKNAAFLRIIPFPTRSLALECYLSLANEQAAGKRCGSRRMIRSRQALTEQNIIF
jgi:hypothetical protein